MSVLGIDEITFGVEDLETCARFYTDWGLELKSQDDKRAVFETLNGCRVICADINDPELPPAFEEGSTLRQVVWGVADSSDIARISAAIEGEKGYYKDETRVGCTDPNGMSIRFQVTQKREIELECAKHNTWGDRSRVNQASPIYERAQPIEVGHVVFFVADVKSCEAFYQEKFGFQTSDRYPGRGAFMRTAEEGGHHDMFLLQRPDNYVGLNHVAFTVRDIHEVFGGGMHISRCGWDTQLGPGRHPVSSAFFWYFKNPAGALVEYYSDEDELTGDWQPRDFEPGPTVFAEWAIAGGIDGNTRRQKEAEAPSGQFMTDKKEKV